MGTRVDQSGTACPFSEAMGDGPRHEGLKMAHRYRVDFTDLV